MVTSWNSLLSHAIIQMVGHEAFARAMVYAKSGHVYDVSVDAGALTVTGRVKGTVRDDYAVTVFLASSRSGTVSVYRSQCSCPVGNDCKHAAAVLIVARHLVAGATVERPEWERTLDKLLADSPAVPAADVAPLALEFGVERIPAFRGYLGRQDLRIRPARRSKSGGWVRSGISWDDLDFVARSYVAEQRELLLQFRAAAGPSARYALPGGVAFTWHRQQCLLGLLDQAATVGLTILAAKLSARSAPSSGGGPRRSSGPSCRGAGGPRVLLDDQELDLSQSASSGIRRMESSPSASRRRPADRGTAGSAAEPRTAAARGGPSLAHDSAGGRGYFLTDFVPRLRQKMSITSTDRSVRLPDYVEPIVGVVVHFRPEHRVRLTGWCTTTARRAPRRTHRRATGTAEHP